MNTDNKKITNEYEKSLKLNQAHYFLFFLIFIVIFACYKIIQPYLHSIILALILSTVFRPIYHKIEKILKGRKNFAAFFSCIFLTILVVLPLGLMLIALIQQGVDSFHAIHDWVAAGKFKMLLENPIIVKVIETFDKFLPDIKKYFPNFDMNDINIDAILLKISSSTGKALLNQGGQLIGNITSVIGKFFLMIFAFFFIVRDQKKIFNFIFHLIPLSTSHETEILFRIKAVSKSVLLGTLVTAVAQGAAGGIAFWIAGLPGLFWGTAMAFSSLIPIAGCSVIWVPAAVYLFLSGHWGYGIFMTLWCAIVVGMIDNFVRPIFMKESTDMSTLLIFFSILGGVSYFGLIGILYGPLIFGLAMVLLYIYSVEFATFLNHQDLN
ncbi:Predicted PurR-regulated permease PerM [Candidatus Magnetomoraceae bacterium gMMP-1]